MGAAVITGRVVNRTRDPVRGASVYIVRAPTSVPDVAQLTGPDGGFALSVPMPGTYRIGVSAAGQKTEQDVDVRGKKASVTVTLGKGTP